MLHHQQSGHPLRDPIEKSASTQMTGGKIHKDGKKPAQKGGKHPKPEHLDSYKGLKLLTSKGTKLDKD